MKHHGTMEKLFITITILVLCSISTEGLKCYVCKNCAIAETKYLQECASAVTTTTSTTVTTTTVTSEGGSMDSSSTSDGSTTMSSTSSTGDDASTSVGTDTGRRKRFVQNEPGANEECICYNGSCNCKRKFIAKRAVEAYDETTSSTSTEQSNTNAPEDQTTANPTTADGTTANPTTADATTADATTGDATTGDATTGDATTGDGTTGDATTGDATTGDATTGDATTGDGTTGDASTGDASTGNASTGDGTTGDATTELTPTFYCYKHIHMVDNHTTVDRGCMEILNEVVDAPCNYTMYGCYWCSTPECNSAFSLQISISLLLFAIYISHYNSLY